MPDTRPTHLLIDAPVDALSPPADIHRWLAELQRMATTVVPGSPAAQEIVRAQEDAEELLQLQQDRPPA